MIINFTGPTFYHQEDENVFFGWIYNLPGYVDIKGKGIELFLELDKDATEDTLNQLKAIFKRWDIKSCSLNELTEHLN
tara:strand:- start:5127 stop:5360 length:234 start_codon:yes stop_codon:yes gene_type:complete